MELTAEEARNLTDRIKTQVEELLPLIKTAYEGRADKALHYNSWNEYCDAEFHGIRLPIEERREAVVQLRESGMSTRAIGAALGASEATVRRDLATASFDAVDKVIGIDGRSRPSTKQPMTEAQVTANYDQAQAKLEENRKTTHRSSIYMIANASLTTAKKELMDALKNARAIDFNFTDEEKEFWDYELNKVTEILDLLRMGTSSNVDWNKELEELL